MIDMVPFLVGFCITSLFVEKSQDSFADLITLGRLDPNRIRIGCSGGGGRCPTVDGPPR